MKLPYNCKNPANCTGQVTLCRVAGEIVAERLGIGKRGAEVHRANIMTKLQAESLSQLVRMVVIATT